MGKYDGHTSVNSIDLPTKLREGRRKGFATRPVKGNISHQPTSAKRPSASRHPGRRICASEVHGYTSKRRKF